MESPEQATQTRLNHLLDEVLKDAAGHGADAAEAAVHESAGLSVSARMGALETIEHTRDKSLGLTVYFNHCKGSASTTDFSEKALRETVAAACSMARYTTEDPCAGLADAELMASEISDLDLYHPWDLEAEAATLLALETEDAARKADKRISNSEGASVARHAGCNFYGNSHGFRGGWHGSRHSISVAVIAEDDSGMQRDGWYSTARVADALDSPADIGAKAAQQALARLGSRKLETCSVPVLYAADVATGLFRHFIQAISGASQYRKASFLLDQLDQAVFPKGFRIHEQPHLPRGLGSAPFDSEGVATPVRDIVNDGILRGYVLDSYAARKLNMDTTGNAGGVHNLTVEAGTHDLSGLLGEMGTGLLVTELMGMGVNTVTGDYSRGAAGYWVENGELCYPVQEITIAGKLQDMFMGIREVGTDTELRGNIRSGSVLIDRMTIAGG